MSEAPNALYFGLSFQICLYTEQPWKTKIVSSSEVEGRFAYTLGRVSRVNKIMPPVRKGRAYLSHMQFRFFMLKVFLL